MYIRKSYLTKIAPFMGKPVIKVITGMRRVGKSYFLRQLVDQAKTARKAPPDSILFIDKESLDFEDIRTYQNLNSLVTDFFKRQGGQKLLFIDEVQEIEQWEKAIASLAKREDIDIYLTGSNAHLFSSELATLLSGNAGDLRHLA